MQLAAFLDVVSLAPPVRADEEIRLDWPETIELSAVVEYVANSLGVNIAYDDSQVNRKVSLQAPQTKRVGDGVIPSSAQAALPRRLMVRCAARTFTLIELLVVVAILGIAACLLTVRLEGLTSRSHLRAATLDLEQTWRTAQHLARTRHRVAWIQFQPGTTRYRVMSVVEGDARQPQWHVLDHVVIVGAAIGTATTRDASVTRDYSPSRLLVA